MRRWRCSYQQSPFCNRNWFPEESGSLCAKVLPVMRHQATKSIGADGSYAVTSKVCPLSMWRIASITSIISWLQFFSPRSRTKSAQIDGSIAFKIPLCVWKRQILTNRNTSSYISHRESNRTVHVLVDNERCSKIRGRHKK